MKTENTYLWLEEQADGEEAVMEGWKQAIPCYFKKKYLAKLICNGLEDRKYA